MALLRRAAPRASKLSAPRRVGLALALSGLIGVVVPGLPLVAGPAGAAGPLTFAEAPGGSPNFIFPITPCAYASTNNIQDFQRLMYRPLYWMSGASPAAPDPQLSLASAPIYGHGDLMVSFSLKKWHFADGSPITPASVRLYLNLVAATPASQCGYAAGLGIPDQIRAVASAGQTVRLFFRTRVNPTWFTDNYLAQITPFDLAWDRTSSGSAGGCATGVYNAAATKTQCAAVSQYLTQQSLATTTYSGPFWRGGSDGPWILRSFSPSGRAVFGANAAYGGGALPTSAQFIEVPYTNFTTLTGDVVQRKLTLAMVEPSPGQTWAGLVASLPSAVSLVKVTPWATGVSQLNFDGSDVGAALVRNLYFRQALQTLVNQNAIVSRAYAGFATPSWGPLPPSTPSTLGSNGPNPYPYSPPSALRLLTAHGWRLSGGTLTCVSPGTGPSQCGNGISLNQAATVSIAVPSGWPTMTSEATTDQANLASVGIHTTVVSSSLDNVIAACTTFSGPDVCLLPLGYTYNQAAFPSGEQLFSTVAGSAVTGFSDTHLSALIRQSVAGPVNLTPYATYVAQQLPFLFGPVPDTVYAATAATSRVLTAVSALSGLRPEALL